VLVVDELKVRTGQPEQDAAGTTMKWNEPQLWGRHAKTPSYVWPQQVVLDCQQQLWMEIQGYFLFELGSPIETVDNQEMPIGKDSAESAVRAVRRYVFEVTQSGEVGFLYHAEVSPKAEAWELYHYAVAFGS